MNINYNHIIFNKPIFYFAKVRNFLSSIFDSVVSRIKAVAQSIFVKHNEQERVIRVSSGPLEIKKPVSLVDVSNAFTNEDLLCKLPSDISNYLLAFIDLRSLATIANICKTWLKIQRIHLKDNHTKDLVSYSKYSKYSKHKNKNHWDELVSNLPRLYKMTTSNKERLLPFFQNMLCDHLLSQKSYEIIFERLNPYLHLLTQNKQNYSTRHVLILLSLIFPSNFSDNKEWIKEIIDVHLNVVESAIFHKLTKIDGGHFAGWSIEWTEFVGGEDDLRSEITHCYPLLYFDISPEILELFAERLLNKIRLHCNDIKNTNDDNLTLHFWGGYPAKPNQHVVVPLLNKLKNLPKNIKKISLFSSSFSFRDENTSDIIEIIKCNPQLVSFTINISKMAENKKTEVRTALEEASITTYSLN